MRARASGARTRAPAVALAARDRRGEEDDDVEGRGRVGTAHSPIVPAPFGPYGPRIAPRSIPRRSGTHGPMPRTARSAEVVAAPSW
jgi:hypothetical protein